jgi:hypothetical protein
VFLKTHLGEHRPNNVIAEVGLYRRDGGGLLLRTLHPLVAHWDPKGLLEPAAPKYF